MKRKIGLLTAVLFALTLTSQTILALDHDPFDPKYNGTYERVASTESEPWVEANNAPPKDPTMINGVKVWIISLEFYYDIIWGVSFEPTKVIVKNSNVNQENIPVKDETKDENKYTGQNRPGTE